MADYPLPGQSEFTPDQEQQQRQRNALMNPTAGPGGSFGAGAAQSSAPAPVMGGMKPADQA